MDRIKFKKEQQRKFLQKVLKNTNCPTLRAFTQFGLDIPYSTLKNYYNESRLLPESLFKEFCTLAKINPKKLNITLLKQNWGQSKGGRISKRNGPTRN
ncbi:MAG: hypothetical protein OQK82_01000 [Candidatus Pacearchaeota archaeon]|nr:hypothetical protein [Candidatus Pacearchaeota archaeon]